MLDMKRRKQFCSGCGKEITGGSCQACRERMIKSLEERRAIKPGCPTIAGEYRTYEEYTPHPLAEHGRKVSPPHLDESGSSFDDIIRAYEDDL